MTVRVSEERGAAVLTLDAETGAPATAIALMAGSAALFGILFVLASITADWPIGPAAVPPYEQITRNAQLFHEIFPALAVFPPAQLALVAWWCVIGLWLVYLPLVWKLRGQVIDHRIVLAGAIMLGLTALIVPPLFSTDPFSYAMYARFETVYHANPYLSTAQSVAPGDALIPYLYWRDIPSPYGPLWTLISQAIAYGPDVSPLELILRFKLVALVLTTLDGWLIYTFVRQRWPEQAGWCYLAFAWNPMVLIEGVVIGHNDVLILAVMLGSALLLARSRPFLTTVGLATSALIKYSTLPVVGLGGLRLLLRTPVRARWWLAIRLAAATLAVAVCAFIPYWAGYASMMSTVNEPGRGVNNLAAKVIGGALWLLTGGRLSTHTPAVIVGITALLFATWQVWEIRRSRVALAAWTIHDELAAWADSLAVFLILWPRIRTWYFLVPLGLALAAGRAPRRFSFWFLIGLTIYSYISYFR
jgi:glycosyl transferase family 87